jgi:alcohol dehydrogenase YqhD (iron-dependent ADH family)
MAHDDFADPEWQELEENEKQIHDGRQSWAKNLLVILRYITEMDRMNDKGGLIRMLKRLYKNLVFTISEEDQKRIEDKIMRVENYYEYVMRDSRITNFEARRLDKLIDEMEIDIMLSGKNSLLPFTGGRVTQDASVV